MARPARTASLKLGMRAGVAACRVLTAKTKNVRTHASAATAGEVEGIHDLRVSVKRLRETMRMLKRLLPRGRYAGVMPLVEQLNDALGAVRQRDVMVLDAEQLAAEAGDSGGLAEMAIAQWRIERALAFQQFARDWACIRDDGFFGALKDLARRTARRKRKRNRAAIEDFVGRSIARALERMQDRLCPVLDSPDPAAMHRLRIGIKRLRYSVEPFTQIMPALKRPCALATEAQELLGLTHDLDALRAALQPHLDGLRPKRRSAAEPFLALLDTRRNERAARALDAVRRLAEPDFERRIMDAIG